MHLQHQPLIIDLNQNKKASSKFIEHFVAEGFGHPTRSALIEFIASRCHKEVDIQNLVQQLVDQGLDYTNQSVSWSKHVLGQYDAVNVALFKDWVKHLNEESEYEAFEHLFQIVDSVIDGKYPDGVHKANEQGQEVIAETTDAIELAESFGFKWAPTDNEGNDDPLITELECVMQNRILWLERNTLCASYINAFIPSQNSSRENA